PSLADTVLLAGVALSLHDALPISRAVASIRSEGLRSARRRLLPSSFHSDCASMRYRRAPVAISSTIATTGSSRRAIAYNPQRTRSEEHTSALQSREKPACRLLLKK